MELSGVLQSCWPQGAAGRLMGVGGGVGEGLASGRDRDTWASVQPASPGP